AGGRAAAGRALRRSAAPPRRRGRAVKSGLRALVVGLGLLLAWQAAVWATVVAHFILPSPLRVAQAWLARADLILTHAQTTLAEVALGLLLGAGFGAGAALLMA